MSVCVCVVGSILVTAKVDGFQQTRQKPEILQRLRSAVKPCDVCDVTNAPLHVNEPIPQKMSKIDRILGCRSSSSANPRSNH